MEAALGTAVGTLQPEWYWTRALDACAVRAAALLVAGSVCSGSIRARHKEGLGKSTVDGAGLRERRSKYGSGSRYGRRKLERQWLRAWAQ